MQYFSILLIIFFFSSRRRHTRWPRDWSSDVCSSDLNPFNTYVSMYAVDYRADFAEAQLLELLQFTQRHNIDIFELKSSYAGAMSFAQFIPYSLNKWFIGDDIFDMNNNIMSIANYLAYFQERTNNLRTSVLRYNPSGLYADAVLDLADALQEGIDSIPQKSAGL